MSAELNIPKCPACGWPWIIDYRGKHAASPYAAYHTCTEPPESFTQLECNVTSDADAIAKINQWLEMMRQVKTGITGVAVGTTTINVTETLKELDELRAIVANLKQ